MRLRRLRHPASNLRTAPRRPASPARGRSAGRKPDRPMRVGDHFHRFGCIVAGWLARSTAAAGAAGCGAGPASRSCAAVPATCWWPAASGRAPALSMPACARSDMPTCRNSARSCRRTLHRHRREQEGRHDVDRIDSFPCLHELAAQAGIASASDLVSADSLAMVAGSPNRRDSSAMPLPLRSWSRGTDSTPSITDFSMARVRASTRIETSRGTFSMSASSASKPAPGAVPTMPGPRQGPRRIRRRRARSEVAQHQRTAAVDRLHWPARWPGWHWPAGAPAGTGGDQLVREVRTQHGLGPALIRQRQRRQDALEAVLHVGDDHRQFRRGQAAAVGLAARQFGHAWQLFQLARQRPSSSRLAINAA
jgi:hypothetical protein